MKFIQHIINSRFRFEKILTRSLQILCTLILIFSNTSCIINENFDEDEPKTEVETSYFIKFTAVVDEAENTRSTTETDGTSSDKTLGAEENESKILMADIYFCDDKGEQIFASFHSMYPITQGETQSFVMQIEADKLVDVAKTQQIILVANRNKTDINNIEDLSTETFSVTSLNSSPIGDFGTEGKGTILPLVNASKFEVDFSELKNLTTDDAKVEALKKYFDNENSLDLSNGTTGKDGTTKYPKKGPLNLERAVARVDFRDITTGNNWKYDIASCDDLKVQLYQLQLFNVSPKAYLLRHTIKGTKDSSEGVSEEVVGLFGDERGTDANYYNWVVSPTLGKSESLFNTLLTGTNEERETIITGIKDSSTDASILLSVLDKRDGYQEYSDTYYQWRYIMENTPVTTGDNLIETATGIVFTFRVLDTKGNPLTKDLTDAPSCISFSKTENAAASTITLTDKDGNWVDVEYQEEQKDSDGKTIKEGGYYLTYYGFIVHNDDDDDTKVGPMEYAVVRNNVYQLSIKKITELPNPEKPQNQYLALDIRVLAWAKRDITVSW